MNDRGVGWWLRVEVGRGGQVGVGWVWAAGAGGRCVATGGRGSARVAEQAVPVFVWRVLSCRKHSLSALRSVQKHQGTLALGTRCLHQTVDNPIKVVRRLAAAIHLVQIRLLFAQFFCSLLHSLWCGWWCVTLGEVQIYDIRGQVVCG